MVARIFRRFVAAFALFLLITDAQPADKIPRIGYLATGPGPTENTRFFVQRLGELGYVEGQNLIFEYLWAAGENQRLPELAADLVRANVDLIVTGGTPATLAAKQATQGSRLSSSSRTPSGRGS